jgi:hypothetical protein
VPSVVACPCRPRSFHVLHLKRHAARQNTVNPESYKHVIHVITCACPACFTMACYITGSAQGVHRWRPKFCTVATTTTRMLPCLHSHDVCCFRKPQDDIRHLQQLQSLCLPRNRLLNLTPTAVQPTNMAMYCLQTDNREIQQHYTCAQCMLLDQILVASDLHSLYCTRCAQCQIQQLTCLQGSLANT